MVTPMRRNRMDLAKIAPSTRRALLALCLCLLAAGCGKDNAAADAADGPAAAGSTTGQGVLGDGPSLGAQDAKVEVLAFIDFECPFCRKSAADVLALVDAHKDSVRFRFLQLPLDVHPHSVVGAKAALAAHAQGKFRAYFEKMMKPDVDLSREKAVAWAVEADLDAKKLAADIDSEAVAKQVARDVGIAGALGVTGTPSYLVNGKLVQGARPVDAWKKLLAEEISRADALLASGTDKARLHRALVAANNPKQAPDYIKYVLDGATPPERPVPAPVARRSGVASAKIVSARPSVQVGEPVRLDPESGDSKTVWRVAVRPDDPRLGPEHAPVTLVLFADFECPFCNKLRPTLDVLRKRYKDDIRVVFKHNPLPFHKHAMDAALAAEAARAQGRFWELYDVLFAQQDKLDKASLRAHAKAAGLDLGRYDTSMAAGGAKLRVTADVEQAAALGARGTPNLFVNGRKIVGAKDEATIAAIVDEELARAKKALAGGAKLEALYDQQIAEGKLLDSLQSKSVSIDVSDDPTRGPPGAEIHIVTFQDFQCPFCARLDPHIAAMEKEFAGRVKVSWLDFPMPYHKQATLAAEAGEEAHKQGKFEAFRAKLMSSEPSKLDVDKLVAVGKQAGLNAGKLRAALDKHTHKDAVASDRALGEKLGVKGTPAVFINGHRFEPQLGFSANTFRSAIRRLLGAR